VKAWLALIVLWTAAVPAFAQTDSDTSGTGTSHGFSVSDGDTVKFGKQLSLPKAVALVQPQAAVMVLFAMRAILDLNNCQLGGAL
jgi:hypothetical protein